jgi:hypothetical protein
MECKQLVRRNSNPPKPCSLPRLPSWQRRGKACRELPVDSTGFGETPDVSLRKQLPAHEDVKSPLGDWGGGLLQPWRRQEGEQRAAGTPTSLGFSVRPARGSGHPLRGRPRRLRAITSRHDARYAGGECLGHRRCIGHGVGRRRLASLLAGASASFGRDPGRRHPHRLGAAGRALSGRRTGWPSPDDVLLAHLRLHLSDRTTRACRGGRHAQPIAGESTAGDADGDTAGIDAGLELSDAGRAGSNLHAAAGDGGPLPAGALPISSGIEGPHRHADRATAGNASSHVVRLGTTDLSATALGPGAGTTTAALHQSWGPGQQTPPGVPQATPPTEPVGIVNGSAADGGRFGSRHCRSNTTAVGPPPRRQPRRSPRRSRRRQHPRSR